jgi:large subunit ribosomal protein L15
MATLNLLKRMTKRPYRRVGRGQSSTRGKQSGRGGKGQTARAGNKRRPELRDIIKKLPKRRGYGKNRGRTVDGTKPDAIAISIDRLEKLFDSGADITRAALLEKGFAPKRSRTPMKIVGGAAVTKKFTITGVSVSASAREALEKAGGSIAATTSPAPAEAATPAKRAKKVAKKN